MTSEKPSIKSVDLLRLLESNNQAVAIKALKKLEKVGSIADLPEIIRIMAGTTDLDMMNHYTGFLSGVKSKKAPAIFVKFLADPAYARIRIELTRACWESQLDFSPYLMSFARLYIADDFVLALEAFSVIEYTCLERTVSKELVKEITLLIKNNLPDQPETKQKLTCQLIAVLEPLVSRS
jgi:hypothetical protein